MAYASSSLTSLDVVEAVTARKAAATDPAVRGIIGGALVKTAVEALNGQLTSLGGRLSRAGKTTGDYRMFVLPWTAPPTPGLLREPGFGGDGIAVEVWALPPAGFGSFVTTIRSPFGVGKVALQVGNEATGFSCNGFSLS